MANLIRDALARELTGRANDDIDAEPITSAISTEGFGVAHRQAMERIRDGINSKESIDDFIDEWSDMPHLADVAKIAISHCILTAEGSSSLANLSNRSSRSTVLNGLRGTWLGYILRFHNSGRARRSFLESMSDASFIVFNYDRCVEYYLWHHLNTTLAVSEDEAREVIRSVPIIHPFGVVGELPELGGHQSFGVSNWRSLLHCGRQIRTYTEAVDSIVGDRIASVMENAERVVFLGFAYHSQNMELLFPHDYPDADTWGTVMGLRSRRHHELQAFLQRTGRYLHLEPVRAVELLTAHHDALF